MRNTLFGVVSSAAIGAALLATATPARAQYGEPYQGPAQAPAPAQPAPPPAAAPGGDIFIFGGSNYHPVVYGKAYGPDAAGPGEPTQGGVCWLFPPRTAGAKWEEVCR